MIISPRDQLFPSKQKNTSISLKRRFRKIVMFPSPEEVFISFNKSSKSFEIVNIVSLKSQCEKFVQSNQHRDMYLSSQQSKEKLCSFVQAERLNFLFNIIQKLENEIRQKRLYEKYPSRQPEIIAFFINRKKQFQKLMRQENTHMGYEEYDQIQSYQTETKRLTLQLDRKDNQISDFAYPQFEQNNQPGYQKSLKRDSNISIFKLEQELELELSQLLQTTKIEQEVSFVKEETFEQSNRISQNNRDIHKQTKNHRQNDRYSQWHNQFLQSKQLNNMTNSNLDSQKTQFQMQVKKEQQDDFFHNAHISTFNAEQHEQNIGIYESQIKLSQGYRNNSFQMAFNKPLQDQTLLKFYEHNTFLEIPFSDTQKICNELCEEQKMSFKLSKQIDNRSEKFSEKPNFDQNQTLHRKKSHDKDMNVAKDIIKKLKELSDKTPSHTITERFRRIAEMKTNQLDDSRNNYEKWLQRKNLQNWEVQTMYDPLDPQRDSLTTNSREQDRNQKTSLKENMLTHILSLLKPPRYNQETQSAQGQEDKNLLQIQEEIKEYPPKFEKSFLSKECSNSSTFFN